MKLLHQTKTMEVWLLKGEEVLIRRWHATFALWYAPAFRLLAHEREDFEKKRARALKKEKR